MESKMNNQNLEAPLFVLQMTIDLHKALALAVSWAKEAGELQRASFRSGRLQMDTKSSMADVVTQVDRACEALLLERITASFPEHSVLGEESGSHGVSGEYQWVVDPLDGTNNYSQGLPVFCVSIGLKYRGVTQLGVVYAPYLDELFTAIRGEGAFLNGAPLRVSVKHELNRCVLGTGFPYDKHIHPVNNIDNLSRILPKLRGMRRMGAAAYDLCCVAAGFLDGYWELGLQEWDVCAGILIVEEAGGIIRPFRDDRGIAIMAGSLLIVEKMGEYILTPEGCEKNEK